MKFYQLRPCLLLLSCYTATTGIAYAAGEEELAKAAQNPIADMISVPVQGNFNLNTGPQKKTQFILNIQPVYPIEFEGFTLPTSIKAGGKNLKLNGVGLRTKAVYKVYVGALYLEFISRDPVKILTADSGKSVQMHFMRDLTQKQLTDDFQDGFARNAGDKTGQRVRFDRLLRLVPDVWKGDTLTFTYLPGKGTTLQSGDKELGVFESKEFADAVFSIWLGPKPVSRHLKQGMLGG